MLSDATYDKLYHTFGQSFDDFMNGKYEQPQDNDRWTGYVFDTADPEYMGRVKIYIIGKYDGIAEPAIPWAVPDINYLGAAAGNFVVPEVGTILRGYFDHGDIQKPVFDSIAFNANNIINSAPFAGITNPGDYPDKMILMQTSSGECLTVNRANGETEFRHRKGTIIKITSDGDVIIQAASAGVKIDANTNININAEQNVNIKAKGQVNINGGTINLGSSKSKQLINNLPTCLATGAPHYIGNTNVFV